jgi:hypothetical protein
MTGSQKRIRGRTPEPRKKSKLFLGTELLPPGKQNDGICKAVKNNRPIWHGVSKEMVKLQV